MIKKVTLIAVLALTMFGCAKDATYQHVYKICYVSPKVNTTITSFWTFRKNQDFHNSAWIRADYMSKNQDVLDGWMIDTLWVDSLGLIPWK